MTTDQALREAKNRWARRRRRLIGYGQWEPFTNAEPARRHVLAIQATGMGLAGISRHTGVNRGSLDHLIYGSHPIPPAAQIRTENAEALLAYWPNLDHYEDRAVIDATGTRRRMQALAVAGWPSNAIHRHIRVGNPQTIEKLRARTKVTALLARTTRDFYDAVSAKTAEDYGVEPWVAGRTRTWAAKRQWAGPEAWDPDTIDDPDAHPDWTGRCGTDHGWWTHTIDGIPACQRCTAAHQAWLAERRDLPAAERFRQLAHAKGAASNRGANLAHDARELMRISGLTYEQVAERLGVTRNHIQQELLRHSETETELAA
ncbi:helix-turn-helix transcriptional regulator [Streptomyces caniscabiei]|uniref:Helix-turn-helix transcriptional regulator n=1 Tax=Streptomyces caniscabiei TaxID=2746961 RepID=A0A927KY88_9ACTN|nr:helix-turn-helix transcriptional regulator [Streptomyces caniscabiei]MBD9721912.1 helix-turn-helix transcriptional regulator [Streptomyces caniscabiei]MDX3509103.1 helix-turn-helix transcriptional regulator [Streptomyces caniscabiei]MDX3717144.1 helix-turn-helix transcriptional regulator [Streptomyces caniscabiei]WEO23011.1 helix-turn-helix transcriptional regulator [Streptomyces caniscabiei]